MFKLLTLSCLLAASVQCKNLPSPAVPYYPQPYQSVYPQPNQPAYPQVYPNFYTAQPKYNVQPAYLAAAPYSPAGYRQVLVPSNPAYNPYYYGYTPYPAYPQSYPYPYAPVNDGTQQPASEAQPGWGEYFNNFWNYVPNFPTFGASESQQTSEAGSSSAAETASTAEATPIKGDKPTDGQKAEQKPISDGQSAEQTPLKQFAPASPFLYFGQPQFYSQQPYQQTFYDPSKLNAVKNGAVSSYLFYRNQPQPVFQHPQLLADQKYSQAPVPQSNQGTAALAYQRYLQYQKPFQSQQDQTFQQQPYQQQYDHQHQQDDSSVVVDSNSNSAQVNVEGQQQAQPKLATGSN